MGKFATSDFLFLCISICQHMYFISQIAKSLQTICGEIFYKEIRSAVLHQTPRTNTHKCNILEKVWFTCCWVQSRTTVIRKGGNKSWNEPSIIIISYKVLLRVGQVPGPQSVRWICARRAWLSWSVSKWGALGNCEANGNFRTIGMVSSKNALLVSRLW